MPRNDSQNEDANSDAASRSEPHSNASLESVLWTDELNRRPNREVNYKSETRWLREMANCLVGAPDDMFQRLAEVALELFQGGSTGLSLISSETGDFYCPVIAGQWASYVGSTADRHFAPCTRVVDENRGQLFRHPERYFRQLLKAQPSSFELLLSPLRYDDQLLGTVWVASHCQDRQFDSQDLRLLECVATFFSAAHAASIPLEQVERERELLRSREEELQRGLEELQDARLAALNLMEDAVEDRKLVERLNQRLSSVSARDAFRINLADSLRALSNPIEIQSKAAQVLGQFLDANRALYVDVKSNQTEIVVHSDYTRDVPSVAGKYLLSDFGASVGQACRAGKTTVVNHVSDNIRLSKNDSDLYAQLQIGAFIAVPLLKSGSLVAIFGVHNAEPREWTTQEVQLVEDTAERTWAVVERAKAEQALRESEQRFRMLADNMSQFAWTCEKLGTVNWYNQRWLDYTGYSFEEMQGWGWTRVHHPDHVDRVKASVQKSCETGRIWEDTFPLRGKDGTYRWFLSRAVPIEGPDGEIRCWFGTNTDITDLRAAELALRESERLAHQANISKSEFLANMSHEIRTPMSAILGHADVLLTHLKDVDNRACVETIKRNGNHLIEIINDILDLSRIEAGKLEIELEECDLPALLEDIWSLMHVRVESKAVEFKVVAEGELPTTIETDPIRLRQILLNLVGNAIKFTEKGCVKLLASRIQRGEIHVIRFDVTDTGIGIAEKQLDKLFKSFSQADTSVARKFGGSGLGLSICKRLAAMLRGELSVESQFGVGSTFRLEIPVNTRDGVTTGQIQTVEVVHETNTRPIATPLKCRVVLVDDRRDVRYVAQHFLEEAGATVVTANHGREGIEVIQEAERSNEPIDIVVMDMHMPVMDGYAATSELRRLGFERPILALTADAMAGERERCLNVGCDEYMAKPIDAPELVAKVRRLSNTSTEELRAARNRQTGADSPLPHQH